MPTFMLEGLARKHNRKDFDCGEESLNEFLRTKARTNANKGHSRTYVLVEASSPETIIGYITLCTGAVQFESVPAELKAVLPQYRVPTVLLARLGVDKNFQGKGFGSSLLVRAFQQAQIVGKAVGFSLFEVDALHEKAREFYSKAGFVEAPSDPLKLFMSRRNIVAFLEEYVQGE